MDKITFINEHSLDTAWNLRSYSCQGIDIDGAGSLSRACKVLSLHLCNWDRWWREELPFHKEQGRCGKDDVNRNFADLLAASLKPAVSLLHRCYGAVCTQMLTLSWRCYNLRRSSRNALPITDPELKLMAAAEIIRLTRIRK